MSARDLFTVSWEEKFAGEPIPTNLPFLEDCDNLSLLATALDSAEKTILKLDKERIKQQFILDFIVHRMDSALASRVRPSAISPDSNTKEQSSKPTAGGDSTKSQSRLSYGQPLRAHGAAAQFAAVMSTAKSKLGFSLSHAARRFVPPDEKQTRNTEDAGSKRGKKLTLVSKFYSDTFEKSNMVRASSAPSLIDNNVEYRSKRALVLNQNSSLDLTSDNIYYSGSSSTNSVDLSSKEGNISSIDVSSSMAYLETDIDAEPSLPPPTVDILNSNFDSKPSFPHLTEENSNKNIDVAPPLPPPPVEKSIKSNECIRKRVARPRNNFYEVPIAFHKEAGETVEDDSEQEGTSSSDEEPIYFNLLLLKDQTLKKVSQLYSNIHVEPIKIRENIILDDSDDSRQFPLDPLCLPVGKLLTCTLVFISETL